jgi:glycosyltransferase involved in cell wall biosynthesis
VERVGDRHTFALRARAAVRAALARDACQVVVEDINKLPLFLPTLTSLPFCAIVPHLFGSTAFEEAAWPMAATVWLAERPVPLVYRRAGFHAISESTRDDLVKRGVRPEAIEVIHPGVDSRHYHPDAAAARTPFPSFVYVGRLKRYKGLDLAIRAVAVARRTRPDIRLSIAGGGDYRDALAALVRELGQETAVSFLDRIPEADKIRLFQQAWANVFPSPKEGWGITVMEAAACGTPSIASDSPGLRDSVRNGETGWLVRHGDVEALAARLVAVAAEPGSVSRFGVAARAHAERLTWDDAARRTEAHLERLVAGHPSR